ncbi:MAG: hypothetical protein ABI397_02390 [Candidatus Saccharimonas sp.]
MRPFFRTIGVIFGTLRAESRQLINRYFGKVEHFDGDAREVCQQVLDRLWEGDFYRTSLGHFNFFWMRDFGTVCDSLVKLGYTERVHHTLRFALKHYRKAGVITTCIDKSGNCFNAPGKSIDAVPWLLHCLVVSDYKLSIREQKFLNRMLKRYSKSFLDAYGNIREIKYAEMRDAVIYDRSAYSVALVARLAVCAKQLQLNFAYDVAQYHDLLIDHYWNGRYFNADYRNNAFSAECALFPFFLGIVDDKAMFHKTAEFIKSKKLTTPYPMIYTPTPDKFRYHWWMTAPWMPNYQGKTIWSWHGEYYLHLLKRYKHSDYKEEYQKFSDMLTLHGNFPEMLNLDGSWYNAPVYKGDPGMVWVALFLEL